MAYLDKIEFNYMCLTRGLYVKGEKAKQKAKEKKEKKITLKRSKKNEQSSRLD